MKRTTFFLILTVVSIAMVGCSGDAVGGNPQMPPANQRIDNNKVPFQGGTPAPTGTAAPSKGDPNG